MKVAIINARIIDTKNNLDEVGGILINEKGVAFKTDEYNLNNLKKALN